MLQDIINPHQEQLRLDEITSSLSAQIVDFCEFDLFSETNVQQNNSEVASNSNGCYDDQSSYPTNHSLTPEIENVEIRPTTTTMTSSTTITSKLNLNDDNNTTTTIDPSNDNNFSLVFDSRGEIENDDICNSIDFNNPCSNNYSIAPTHFLSQQEQFDISSLNNPSHHATTTTNMVLGTSSLNHQFNNNNNNNILDPPPLMAHPNLPPVFEDECLSSLPSYYMKSLNNSSLPSSSSSLIDPTIGSYISNALSTDISMIPAALYFGSGLPPHHESDFQGNNNNNGGSFGHDHNMQRLLNCTNDLQAFSNENQHHMKGSPVGPLTPEITNLEDSNYKVGKLSVEERKEKIQRYMKKRNQRNFSKKIKYACRKTLADSRPRVRGRFAKNDELIAAARAALIHHEEEMDEECRQIGVVKEEEDMAHTTDILAHLSGVTSFNCNNSINPIHSLL